MTQLHTHPLILQAVHQSANSLARLSYLSPPVALCHLSCLQGVSPETWSSFGQTAEAVALLAQAATAHASHQAHSPVPSLGPAEEAPSRSGAAAESHAATLQAVLQAVLGASMRQLMLVHSTMSYPAADASCGHFAAMVRVGEVCLPATAPPPAHPRLSSYQDSYLYKIKSRSRFAGEPLAVPLPHVLAELGVVLAARAQLLGSSQAHSSLACAAGSAGMKHASRYTQWLDTVAHAQAHLIQQQLTAGHRMPISPSSFQLLSQVSATTWICLQL